MKEIDELLERLRAEHVPNPPARDEDVRAAERRWGLQMPLDVKRFYAAMNGVKLYRAASSPFAVPSIQEIRPVSHELLGGGEPPPDGTEHWYTLGVLLDGNYLAMDLAHVRLPNEMPIIDCFHETFGHPGHALVVAMSFTELLLDLLRHKGQPYWLKKGFTGYGDALD